MAGLIEHPGVVRRITGDSMHVEIDLAGCGSCGHGSQCGMGKLTSQQQKTSLIRVRRLAHAEIGDTVNLALSDNRVGAYALLGYLIPALGFVFGAILGSQAGDVGTALGAFGSLVLTLSLIRLGQRRFPQYFAMPEARPLVQPTLPHAVRHSHYPIYYFKEQPHEH